MALASLKNCTDYFHTLKQVLPRFNAFQRTLASGQNKPESSGQYDVVVIGGGIVGAASARELIMRHPSLKFAIVEKEKSYAFHQSGNNSGVVHAGIYYKPGSLKAKLCVKGMKLAYEYFDKNSIPYKKVGKLIVATNKIELQRLADLYDRAIANGVQDLKIIGEDEIEDYEPHCWGLEALWCPHTGIVDWGLVTKKYVDDFIKQGGAGYLNFNVTKFTEGENPNYPVVIHGDDRKGYQKKIEAKYVLTCCGLHSDSVAMLTGCPEEPKIIPFRGEYLYLAKDSNYFVRGNIYPVPDPRFPFLGVHFTPTMSGRVLLGPNAILAFRKEGYRFQDFSFKDTKDMILYPGFRKMALKYMGFGLKEMVTSALLPLRVQALQNYIHDLTVLNVEPGPSGVRAQALAKDGTLVDDFVFDSRPSGGAIGSRVLHCRNAPSPGATSSLAIAEMIADRMKENFKL